MPAKPITLSDFGYRENLMHSGVNKQIGLQRIAKGAERGRNRDS